MNYELISEEDYENFPEEPEMKFVALEKTCRQNMMRLISEDTRQDFDDLIRNQYMMTVATAATALGIEGVDYPYRADRPAMELENFMVNATGAVTRIRLRSTSAKGASVRLSTRTRGRIELQIRRLRTIIEEGEMPPGKRRALLDRLDQLSTELTNSRLNFGRAMAMLAFVSLGVTTGTSFLADAPDAIATITSLIGLDKQAEDDETKRLGPPAAPKALPAPRTAQNVAPAFESGSMDDEIPF